MDLLSTTDLALLFAVGLGSGWLGAWIGIGGGIVLVPTLSLFFDVDVKVAIASSLVSVIVTSTATGSVYVHRGLTNPRLAIALEVGTTLGAVAGGLAAVVVAGEALYGVFSVVMGATAVLMFRGASGHVTREIEKVSSPPPAGALDATRDERGKLASAYFDRARGGIVHYSVERFSGGFGLSFVAGAISGLLGVGGGFLKVPAMNLVMNVPIKVAGATSNFMIGVTAAASVFVYFGRGFVHPLLVAPVALGVLGGALLGTRTAATAHPALIKRILAIVLIAVAVQMGLRAFGVTLGH